MKEKLAIIPQQEKDLALMAKENEEQDTEGFVKLRRKQINQFVDEQEEIEEEIKQRKQEVI